MTQKSVNLDDTPQAVAGAGLAMIEGRDSSINYWISAATPANNIPAFTVPSRKREPMTIPDGYELWLSGSGQTTVFAETEPS